MSASRIEPGDVKRGRVVVCDARAFQRLVVMPHIFIFILLTVGGSILGQPLLANVSRIGAVLYLLFVNLAVQNYLRAVSLRLLQIHLGALGLFMVLLSLFLGQDSFSTSVLPTILILLALSFLPLNWRQAAQLVALPVGLMLLLAIVDLLTRAGQIERISQILMIVIFSALIPVVAALVSKRSALTHMFEADIPYLPSETASRDTEFEITTLDTRVENRLRDDADAFLAEELRLEQSWKFCLAIGALVTLGLGVLVSLSDSSTLIELGIPIVVALATGVVGIRSLRRNLTLRQFYARQFFVMLLLVTNVAVTTTLVFRPFSAGAVLVAIFVLLFSLALQPLPPFLAASFIAATLLVGGGIGLDFFKDYRLLLSLVPGAAVCFALALFVHQGVHARALLLSVRRCIESSVSNLLFIRLFAERLLAFLNGERALLVQGDAAAEVITRAGTHVPQTEPAFVRALVEKAAAQKQSEGILYPRELGAQFFPRLHDWFGYAPHRIYFVRFTAIVHEQEQELLLFCPVTWHARLTGVLRNFRYILGFAALVRGAVAAARSRFQSSDVLLSIQRILALREHELADTVHLVNNIAQDIAIQCDELVRMEHGPRHKSLVEAVDNLARNLSSGVSDLKLIRELVRLKEPSRFESVAISSALDVLKAYAQFRTRRRDEQFLFNIECSTTLALAVASREFFETSLRLILKLIVGKVRRGESLAISVKENSERIEFLFAWVGSALDPAVERALLQPAMDTETEVVELNQAKAIQVFSAVSRAELSLSFDAARQFGQLNWSFPISKKQAADTPRDGGAWALLVDDNPQVTQFYARIASALGLPYHLADSTHEALRLLDCHGKPRIVITDIQLGEGSGLELVRNFRSRFGAALPIIVVSGQTSDSFGNEATTVGATMVLTKPVSRSKLFAEIKILLGLQ
jgi:CheY-like chemotaxis protein